MTGEPSVTPDPSPSPTRLMIPTPGPTTWDVITQWVAMGLLITGTLAFIFFAIDNLFSSEKKREIKPFYLWIATIAFFGGLLSFFLPIAINSGFGKDDDGPVLRQLILYTTGGVLGVITLGETHRKNNQEKEKNENDHTRQVHAERRSRYTKAVEQLAHENASIRLGGVFALFGLADEWIADESLEPQKRQKEGQTIVKYLCAYIRSLPAKQTEASFKTGSYPQDEAEIRQTIFMEMSSRFIEGKNKIDKKSQHTQVSWNNFIFNFNNSHIFYPLNDLVFFNADFQGAKFYRDADFSDSRFYQETQFTKSKFFSCHPFKGTEFYGNTYFNKSQFNPPGGFTQKIGEAFEKFSTSGPVNQHDNHPTEGYMFFRSVFYEVASFQKAHFYTNESINQSSFKKDVDFQESIFDGTEAFIETSFSVKPNFKGTLFSYLIPDIFNNSISQDGKKLNNGIATLLQDDKMFLSRKKLPVGASLFDPSSWNSTDKKYDQISHSAL